MLSFPELLLRICYVKYYVWEEQLLPPPRTVSSFLSTCSFSEQLKVRAMEPAKRQQNPTVETCGFSEEKAAL